MVAGHLRNRNGVWYVSMSYTDAYGKKKTVLRSTGIPAEKGNKKKAEKVLLEARQALQEELDKGDPDTLEKQKETMLFTFFLADWLEMMRSSVELTTFSAYQTAIKEQEPSGTPDEPAEQEEEVEPNAPEGQPELAESTGRTGMAMAVRTGGLAEQIRACLD